MTTINLDLTRSVADQKHALEHPGSSHILINHAQRHTKLENIIN